MLGHRPGKALRQCGGGMVHFRHRCTWSPAGIALQLLPIRQCARSASRTAACCCSQWGMQAHSPIFQHAALSMMPRLHQHHVTEVRHATVVSLRMHESSQGSFLLGPQLASPRPAFANNGLSHADPSGVSLWVDPGVLTAKLLLVSTPLRLGSLLRQDAMHHPAVLQTSSPASCVGCASKYTFC